MADVGETTVESPTINLGSSLRQHVSHGIERAISRSFNAMESAHVVFKEDSNLFSVIIQMKIGGAEFVAESKGTDCYKAFSMALIKIEGQLRKTKDYVRVRKGHRRPDKDGMLDRNHTERWEEPEGDFV